MIENKVTELRAQVITVESIQDHLDAENAGGWYLVSVTNQIGWYRFFWAKESS